MEPIKKVPFTKEMKSTHTILIPTMLPIHFKILGNVLENYGYHIKILDNCGPQVIEQGLKNVHNDTCYPAQLVIGQMIDALEHCELPLDKVALLITQTGGGCPRLQLYLPAAQGAEQVRIRRHTGHLGKLYQKRAVWRLLSAVDHAATGALRGAVRRFDYDLVQPVHPV